MRVDYGALERTAARISAAAAQLAVERALPSPLESGSGRVEGAYGETASDRRRTVAAMRESMEAQSRACGELVAAFRLLDAQIAASVGS